MTPVALQPRQAALCARCCFAAGQRDAEVCACPRPVRGAGPGLVRAQQAARGAAAFVDITAGRFSLDTVDAHSLNQSIELPAHRRLQLDPDVLYEFLAATAKGMSAVEDAVQVWQKHWGRNVHHHCSPLPWLQQLGVVQKADSSVEAQAQGFTAGRSGQRYSVQPLSGKTFAKLRGLLGMTALLSGLAWAPWGSWLLKTPELPNPHRRAQDNIAAPFITLQQGQSRASTGAAL